VSYFPVKLSESDRQIILGALDSLGAALAEHDHEWSVGERTIYEERSPTTKVGTSFVSESRATRLHARRVH
jgi:hypothetical protein